MATDADNLLKIGPIHSEIISSDTGCLHKCIWLYTNTKVYYYELSVHYLLIPLYRDCRKYLKDVQMAC